MRFISNGTAIDPVIIPSPFPLRLLFLFLPFPCFAPGRMGLNIFVSSHVSSTEYFQSTFRFVFGNWSFYSKFLWNVTYFHVTRCLVRLEMKL